MSVNSKAIDRRDELPVSRSPRFDQVKTATNASTQGREGIERFVGLLDLLFGSLEIVIGLRVLLKFMGANPENTIAHLVYVTTAPFLLPFAGLASNPQVNGAVFELTSTFAILVYGLIAWVITRLVWLMFYQPETQ